MISVEESCEIILAIFVVICFSFIILEKRRRRKNEIEDDDEDEDEEEKPKIVLDPQKQLAQQVKFVIRLKKKMRRFKGQQKFSRKLASFPKVNLP